MLDLQRPKTLGSSAVKLFLKYSNLCNVVVIREQCQQNHLSNFKTGTEICK